MLLNLSLLISTFLVPKPVVPNIRRCRKTNLSFPMSKSVFKCVLKLKPVPRKKETKWLQNLKRGYTLVLNNLFCSSFIKSEQNRRRIVCFRRKRARDRRENGSCKKKVCTSSKNGRNNNIKDMILADKQNLGILL